MVWAGRPIAMADYYTVQQLAQVLGIAEATIAELQTKGLLQPTVKDGRSFFSSRQAHCLRAAIRWARKDKIDLPEAFARVEERWLAQTSAQKD
jgi:DNA-binding transcriptional MerR regulator